MSRPSASGTATASAGPAVRRITHPLVARRLTVRDVTDLSARLRRVVLGGADLNGFASDGPTDHAKVFFPARADDPRSLAMPAVADGRWVNRKDPRLVYRDYTVRAHRPGSGEVALEMLAHHHGPAGRWAAQASPGQVLGLLGPKSSKLPPLDRDWYLLAVDETGLPALSNWLERLEPGAAVQAFVEVSGTADLMPMPGYPGGRVTWLRRGDAAAGTTTLLPDAVASARFGDLTDGSGWVWAVGEASAVRAIRAHLHQRGMPKDCFTTSGYWRRGVTHFDHHSLDA